MKSTTSFEHIADIWDEKTGNSGKGIISNAVTVKHILAELGNLKNKKVYEIACGNGFLARKLVVKAKEVRASDVSKTIIGYAKNKYDPGKINFEVRDATDFKGIPKNYYDAVVIHAGIFYIKDLAKLAAGVRKILKPGGTLIFTEMHPLMYVANQDMYSKEKLKDVLEKYKPYLKTRNKVVHKRWFVNGAVKQAQYHQFKRPFSLYINIFSEYGLVTTKVIEPGTVTMMKGKNYKSSIPSSLIIKCTKV